MANSTDFGEQRLTRGEQHFFLNSTEIRGIQDVNLNYDNNAAPLKHLGMVNSRFLPAGPQVGSLDLNYLLISSDQFINFTGNSSFNGFLVKNKNNVTENFGFTDAYLTSYNFACSIGQIPLISISATAFGNMGRIVSGEAPTNFAAIPSSTLSDLTISNAGSIDINMNGFNNNKVESFGLSITTERNPIYKLNKKYPNSVQVNWPIQIEADFQIGGRDYSPFDFRKFPMSTKNGDLTINVKDYQSHNNIISFSFSNLTMMSEAKTDRALDDSIINLKFRGYVFP